MRVPSAVGCHHDPGLRLASCVTSLTERVCHVTAWMGQVGVKGKLSSTAWVSKAAHRISSFSDDRMKALQAQTPWKLVQTSVPERT